MDFFAVFNTHNIVKRYIMFQENKSFFTFLTLIRFCGVHTDPRQIKMVGISQRNMIWQRLQVIVTDTLQLFKMMISLKKD